jgi:Zn-dependent M28 family amino/carboxypeptidase
MARAYVRAAITEAPLGSVGPSYEQAFTFPRRDGTRSDAANVVGMVRGTRYPARYIVITAHYDHVGGPAVDGDSIYNGADDNATGTAALIELARYFAAHPPANSMIFVGFDAEESNLAGARAFVANPPVPRDSIIMNVNMDMVSRSPAGELYAVGTYAYPVLRPYIDRAKTGARVKLLTGHEGPTATGSDNWTNSSDHGPFNAQKIPFLYFGVEDHPGYHKPSDEFAQITPVFFANAIETVLDVLLDLDRNLEPVVAVRRNPTTP